MEELRAKDYKRWLELLEGGFSEQFDLASFKKTALDSIEKIIKENKGKRVAVVCHGGVINVWAAHVLGIDEYLFFAPEYTSINRFMASSTGVRSLVSLNETGHLRDDLPLGNP
jgi:probable phosphoglycerate mutase